MASTREKRSKKACSVSEIIELMQQGSPDNSVDDDIVSDHEDDFTPAILKTYARVTTLFPELDPLDQPICSHSTRPTESATDETDNDLQNVPNSPNDQEESCDSVHLSKITSESSSESSSSHATSPRRRKRKRARCVKEEPTSFAHLSDQNPISVSVEPIETQLQHDLDSGRTEDGPQLVLPSTSNGSHITENNTQQERDESVGENLLNDTETGDDFLGNLQKKKRAKRGKADPSNWKCSINKKARLHGEAYKGLKSVNNKWESVTKPPRMRSDRCTKESCRKRKMSCHEFTDEDCDAIFKSFWKKGDWQQKKAYVCKLVEQANVKQVTVPVNSRRRKTLTYHLMKDSARKRVCKEMFLATTGVGEWSVRQWVTTVDGTGMIGSPVEENKKRNPRGGKRCTDAEDRAYMRAFLTKLPTLPSHYCRAQSTKNYLEPDFKTKADLHKVYVEECKSVGKEPLCSNILHEMFEELNLALYQPRKDQCDECFAHKKGNIPEDELKKHRKKVEQAREEKEKDKVREDCCCYTQDLQALLHTPRCNASALYYRTKLCVHNLTFYNQKTHAAKNYLWHEAEGGLTANEFSSIYVDFLTDEVEKNGNIKLFILWSDGCCYQNRNAMLSNAILQFAVDKNVTVMQKYLVVGHTQMECDSVHAAIERRLKKKEIFVPAEYVREITLAKTKEPTYKVQYLDHKFFKDYSGQPYYPSIRPGKRKGDPVVVDIKCLKYEPSGSIQYKLDFASDWQNLPQRGKPVTPGFQFPQLHSQPLPLSTMKYKHLQELKEVMHKDYHSFYDNLPHNG